ncbi:MAG: ZIP family metal transporter [Planctomycetota bacterium]|nr:ZIP family metal transporter [Planctomycetota bacterium]
MPFVFESAVAGLIASIACGLGVLPLLLGGHEIEKRIGLGYGFAGGLMFAASVYNLLLPAFTLGPEAAIRLWPVTQTLVGMFAGCLLLWSVNILLTPERLDSRWLKPLGGRVETLVFLAMTFHSIPEGVAVGVGFGSEGHDESLTGLGLYIAIAIAIHNMPEGLAVALPMRARGASISKCFLFAFLTSLPQPIAAIPASLLVWFFEPLILPFLGFAAGAMMYLVVVELIPDALETRSPSQIAWSFMAGFGLMVLVQVAL